MVIIDESECDHDKYGKKVKMHHAKCVGTYYLMSWPTIRLPEIKPTSVTTLGRACEDPQAALGVDSGLVLPPWLANPLK